MTLRTDCLSLIRFVFLIAVLPFAAQAADWSAATTSGLIVGVLKWQKPGLDSFSNVHRKDRELYDVLIRRGVSPENLGILLDAQATRAKILDEVRNRSRTAQAGSTFILYYAGHGLQENKTTYLANYDLDINQAALTGLSVDDFYPILASEFKGNTLILMGDFCYSGSLKILAEKLSRSGKRAVFLTSSSASNESTGNWTFSQTVIDCFSGYGLCDVNSDGRITLEEMSNEVSKAMVGRERQLFGYGSYGVPASLIISPVQNRIEAKGLVGSYVLAPYSNRLQPARVLAESTQDIKAEFYFYSDKKSVKVAKSQIKKLEFKSLAVGTRTKVSWGGKWYPAKVIQTREPFHLVTYEGYDSTWDEWVTMDRMLDPKGVMIEWKGKWFPGQIKKKENGKYFVSYEGYGPEWDEWIGPNRLEIGANQSN
ncbi:MAG: caspase family protein [Spirochaetia bacterium]|nr:caspase family protein [Spirochaetia bacterium]